MEEDSFPTNVVVEDITFDADTPTALADVTADGASKDCFTAVPLVTHACPRESSRSNGQEEASRRESRRSKATDASDVTASAGNKDSVANAFAVPLVTHACPATVLCPIGSEEASRREIQEESGQIHCI